MLDVTTKMAMLEVVRGMNECASELRDLVNEADSDKQDTMTAEMCVDILYDTLAHIVQMVDKQILTLEEVGHQANVQVASQS